MGEILSCALNITKTVSNSGSSVTLRSGEFPIRGVDSLVISRSSSRSVADGTLEERIKNLSTNRSGHDPFDYASKIFKASGRREIITSSGARVCDLQKAGVKSLIHALSLDEAGFDWDGVLWPSTIKEKKEVFRKRILGILKTAHKGWNNGKSTIPPAKRLAFPLHTMFPHTNAEPASIDFERNMVVVRSALRALRKDWFENITLVLEDCDQEILFGMLWDNICRFFDLLQRKESV